MDATIGYLGQVREDLMDAAFRTGRIGRGRVRVRRPRRIPAGRVLVAVSSVVVLVTAGGLGWVVTHGNPFSSVADERPAFGATGATGSTGPAGMSRHDAADEVVPAPVTWDAARIAGLVSDQSAGGGATAPDIAPSLPVGDVARIVRTAEMTLVLPPDSFDERFASAQDVAELHGGFVQISTGRERAGTLVMRVPSGKFADAMRDLRALGDVEVQTIQGEDVTAEYVDLQARLRIAKSRREVLLGLMAKAVSIEQTIRVQNALDDTQLRIEELQGSIGLLEDRTSFATIRVQLHEEGVEPEAEVKNPSVTTAWDRAIAGFFGVIAGVVVGLGYLIPILAIGAVVWLTVRWVRRRRAA
jgi:hypothetical protein